MGPKYSRVVLKLSGEAMAGNAGVGIDADIVQVIAEKVKGVHDSGVETSIVVGGGDSWRGRDSGNMNRATSDYMGMPGTIINALALQDALEGLNAVIRVQMAIEMKQVAEPHIRRGAIHHLEKGRIVIFTRGTGNPYFPTDTTAALRAAEIDAGAILLAKKGVDGVYNSDPKVNKNARKFDGLAYFEILRRELKIMDSTATSLYMDNKILLIVSDISEPSNIVDVVKGSTIGTNVK